jgi:hypothetical protein
MSDSSANVVAVVVDWWFLSSVMWMARNGCWGLWCWRRFNSGSPDRVSEVYLGDIEHEWKTGSDLKIFQVKAQCFGTGGGDACRYRYPFGSAAAVTFSVIGLWVKTLDHRSRRW